mmetsp:Transcript_28897/g.88611  ORF Transcript_28897/g.88611 Transcript_28897/m.88611 type:complete len:113 (-) Transcript_28897:551-889(-)
MTAAAYAQRVIGSLPPWRMLDRLRALHHCRQARRCRRRLTPFASGSRVNCESTSLQERGSPSCNFALEDARETASQRRTREEELPFGDGERQSVLQLRVSRWTRDCDTADDA